MNVNATTPEAIEETERARNDEKTEKSVNEIRADKIYISTWAEEANEATNLEGSAYAIEKCTVDKVAVVAKCEGFKTDTNTSMKQYPNTDLRCIWDGTSVKYIYL